MGTSPQWPKATPFTCSQSPNMLAISVMWGSSCARAVQSGLAPLHTPLCHTLPNTASDSLALIRLRSTILQHTAVPRDTSVWHTDEAYLQVAACSMGRGAARGDGARQGLRCAGASVTTMPPAPSSWISSRASAPFQALEGRRKFASKGKRARGQAQTVRHSTMQCIYSWSPTGSHLCMAEYLACCDSCMFMRTAILQQGGDRTTTVCAAAQRWHALRDAWTRLPRRMQSRAEGTSGWQAAGSTPPRLPSGLAYPPLCIGPVRQLSRVLWVLRG